MTIKHLKIVDSEDIILIISIHSSGWCGSGIKEADGFEGFDVGLIKARPR